MPDIIQRLKDAYITGQYAEIIKTLLPKLFQAADEGKIIELLCKVGTTVYVIAKCESVHVDRDDDYFTGTGAMECPFENQCNFEDCDDDNEQIFETTITDFWYGKQNGNDVEMFLDHLEMTAKVKDFGKTIFFTLESAKIALQERKK